MKVLIVYYSLYGHVAQMAQAVAEGVGQVPGAEAVIRRVPETLPAEVIAKMGAAEVQKEEAAVPVCTVEDLGRAEAVVFGTPTRFGNMCGQMRQFLDATGGLWAKHALVGKPAGVFTSSNTQHGGQETTIISFFFTLLHQGMILVGLPYSFEGQSRVDEITGGSPYGPSTIAGPDGSRRPSQNELAGARFLGQRVAEVAAKLSA